MAPQSLRLNILRLRVVLILAALLSFSVWSNAGPRVFPSQASAVTAQASGPESKVLRATLTDEWQEHSDRGPQEPEPLALIVKPSLVLPLGDEVLNKRSYASFLLTHASFSQPPERAPPV